jgi:hypothetical protein
LPFVSTCIYSCWAVDAHGTLFKAGIHVLFNRYSQLGIKNTFRDSIRKYSRCFWLMVPPCSLDHYLGTTKSNLSPGIIQATDDRFYGRYTSGTWMQWSSMHETRNFLLGKHCNVTIRSGCMWCTVFVRSSSSLS